MRKSAVIAARSVRQRWREIGGVLVIGVLLWGTSAQASHLPRFQGKAVGNAPDGGRVAKRSFPVGAGYDLYFRDNRRSRTRYRLCAIFRGTTRNCVNGRTRRRGVDSIQSSPAIFNPQQTGTLVWRWYVGGRTAASWTVTITVGD